MYIWERLEIASNPLPCRPGKIAWISIHSLREKFCRRSPEWHKYFTHQLKHVASSACDLVGTVDWLHLVYPVRSLIYPPANCFYSRSHVKDSRGRDAEKSFSCQSRGEFVGEVTVWDSIPAVVDSGVGRTRDSLRVYLDPRSFAVSRMTRRAIRDRSHEGRSHYRPRREKRRKKEVSVVRFASWEKARTTLSAHARERAHESREKRREERFPCFSFVSSPSATLNRFL